MEFDEDWKFCLSSRPKNETPEYYDRMEAIVPWVWDHAEETTFRVPKVKIVQGADEGVPMIKDVFQGKTSMEKVVIQHPM